MALTRRSIGLGMGAVGLGLAGSIAHQTWLSSSAASARPASLAPIPVIDLGEADLAAYALSRQAQMASVRDACVGPLTPAAQAALRVADAMARDWLAASGTPYLGELARIASGSRVVGAHLLNASYEWGCTTLAAPAPDHASARLLRTLDWPFNGLGARVECVRQRGSAGGFAHLTWPGAVGLLTGTAPGRFAAAINQAPMKRRAPGDFPTVDALLAVVSTWRSAGRIPPLHLLRQVFEQAPDYAAARRMLERTPVAAPVLFTLVGLTPDETCVIERDVEDFATREGVASAANVWRYGSFRGEWRGGPAAADLSDSKARSEAIEAWAGRTGAPFDWVRPPILNAMTRLAVEADPARGRLLALGYEEDVDGDDVASPATLLLDLDLTA